MKRNLLLKELRDKDNKTLFSDLQDAQKKIVDLKFKSTFRKLKNYKEISLERKKVARIWTILSQRAAKELEDHQDKSGEKDEKKD